MDTILLLSLLHEAHFVESRECGFLRACGDMFIVVTESGDCFDCVNVMVK